MRRPLDRGGGWGHVGVTHGGWVDVDAAGRLSSVAAGPAAGGTPVPARQPMASCVAAAGRPAGRGGRPGRRHATAGSATSWARPRRACRPAATPGPDREVLGGQDQLQPDGVAAPVVEGEVAQAGGFGGADAILDAGALAVAQLQAGQVAVGLVGEEDLEAVPVVVGEAQLRTGVGVFPAADRARAWWPVAKVDPAGQLDHLRTTADLAIGVDRWDPGRFGLGEDRLADMLIDLHAQREPDTLVAWVPGQPGAGPGAIRAHQHRLLVADGGQLRQRRGRPARSGHRCRRPGRCLIGAGPPAAHPGQPRGPGRPAGDETRTNARRCPPRPA
jgi:hypothetical protein